MPALFSCFAHVYCIYLIVSIMRNDIIDGVEKMVNTIENMNRNQSDADCFGKDR